MIFVQNLLAQNIDNLLGGNTDDVGFFIINSTNDTIFICTGYGKIGLGHSTRALGPASVAMGISTQSMGLASTAMGNVSIASGDLSTAMGNQTTASGQFSTAMGTESSATGTYSTAMGFETSAGGKSSTSMGHGTRATTHYSSAIGRYNYDDVPATDWDPDDFIFMIENGTSNADRSNLLIVKKNGDMWIQGTLTENSDKRLKSEIERLKNSLNKIRQLSGVNFY
jgi:hypothetical protein